MPKEEGLVTDAKGTFKSREQIIYDNMEKVPPQFEGKRTAEITFDSMIDEAIRRRDARLEIEDVQDVVEIKIETTTPVVIPLFGDPHLEGMFVDYELIRSHIKEIKRNPKMYPIFGGDLIEGAAFNPAQDNKLGSFDEESLFAIKLLDELEHSTIAYWMGDHDKWAESSGPTIYSAMRERYNAPVLRGSSTLKLKVGKTEYTIVGAHRLPGNSMYNNTHPENRESKFGQQGADVYVGWHTHRKGISQQAIKQADGSNLLQTFVSSGPYQYSSKYAQKLGFGKQRDKELGAVWLVLHPYRKEVEAFWSMESAKERIEPYLTGKLREIKPEEPFKIINEIAK